MPKSGEVLRVFKAYSGKALHASKDGKKTLCGRWITIIWTELRLWAWQDSDRKCEKCKFKAERLCLVGEQSTLVKPTEETTE